MGLSILTVGAKTDSAKSPVKPVGKTGSFDEHMGKELVSDFSSETVLPKVDRKREGTETKLPSHAKAHGAKAKTPKAEAQPGSPAPSHSAPRREEEHAKAEADPEKARTEKVDAEEAGSRQATKAKSHDQKPEAEEPAQEATGDSETSSVGGEEVSAEDSGEEEAREAGGEEDEEQELKASRTSENARINAMALLASAQLEKESGQSGKVVEGEGEKVISLSVEGVPAGSQEVAATGEAQGNGAETSQKADAEPLPDEAKAEGVASPDQEGKGAEANPVEAKVTEAKESTQPGVEAVQKDGRQQGSGTGDTEEGGIFMEAGEPAADAPQKVVEPVAADKEAPAPLSSSPVESFVTLTENALIESEAAQKAESGVQKTTPSSLWRLWSRSDVAGVSRANRGEGNQEDGDNVAAQAASVAENGEEAEGAADSTQKTPFGRIVSALAHQRNAERKESGKDPALTPSPVAASPKEIATSVRTSEKANGPKEEGVVKGERENTPAADKPQEKAEVFEVAKAAAPVRPDSSAAPVRGEEVPVQVSGAVQAQGDPVQGGVKIEKPQPAMDQEDIRAAREILRQVSNGARVTFLSRGDRAVIQLRPEALGRVHIEVQRTAEGMTAKFRVESNEAKDALNSQLPQLKQAFEGRGVNLVNIEVALADKRSNNGGQPGRGKRANQPNFKFDDTAEADVTAAPVETNWKPWGFEARV